MVRFEVPSSGVDVKDKGEAGIIVEWYGGTFDQRKQRVSTSVPFAMNKKIPEQAYPPANPGESPTCDGLSIRGSYLMPDPEVQPQRMIPVSGVKRCVVFGVTTIGSDTGWHDAGGDAGIFVGGCEEQYVANCRNIGNRDCGIYASSSPHKDLNWNELNVVTLRCRTIIENNLHVNCFVGAAIKRSAGYSKIVGNHAENCPYGFLFERVRGRGSVGAVIAHNAGNQCGTPIRLQLCHGFDVHDNHFTSLGAVYEANGRWQIESLAGCKGMITAGCERGSVRRNTVFGVTDGVNEVPKYAKTRTLLECGDIADPDEPDAKKAQENKVASRFVTGSATSVRA